MSSDITSPKLTSAPRAAGETCGVPGPGGRLAQSSGTAGHENVHERGVGDRRLLVGRFGRSGQRAWVTWTERSSRCRSLPCRQARAGGGTVASVEFSMSSPVVAVPRGGRSPWVRSRPTPGSGPRRPATRRPHRRPCGAAGSVRVDDNYLVWCGRTRARAKLAGLLGRRAERDAVEQLLAVVHAGLSGALLVPRGSGHREVCAAGARPATLRLTYNADGTVTVESRPRGVQVRVGGGT